MTKAEQDIEKKIAAEKATEFVKSGMVIGLGSGSTVYYAVKKLGKLVKKGLDIIAVSTSDSTTELAQSEGINLFHINKVDKIDLTIDGADEVDRSFNGIKGGGGALLFEKIVALSSERNIWIVDSGKVVDKLGNYPLPVEVIPFGYRRVFKELEAMKLSPVLRMKGHEYYFTDSRNFILDLHTSGTDDLQKLNDEIKLINGVVETGLFINIADTVIVGKNNSVEIINK